VCIHYNTSLFSAPCVNSHNVGAYYNDDDDDDELMMTMMTRCLDTRSQSRPIREKVRGDVAEGINVFSYFRFMSRVNDKDHLTGY
jgi:hypothetical protein